MENYSFVIPAYNCESTIEECVRSILAQAAIDLEVVIIEDGSTDGTGRVCDALADRFSEVRVIHQPNSGVSQARNRGIREAKGEYLVFVDADDLLLPFSQRILTAMDRSPDALVFGMEFQFFQRQELVRQEEHVSDSDCLLALYELGESFTELFHRNCFSSSCNKIYKRSVILENEIFFDSRLINYEDLAFSLRYIAKSKQVQICSEVCYLYQIQVGSDHTVQRIARIDDVIGNTDLIAMAFDELDAAIGSQTATAQLRRILFDIYISIFWQKMQTVKYGQIRRYCGDFKKNSNILKCMPYIHGLSGHTDRVLKWIRDESAVGIWVYVRYRKCRNAVVKTAKKLLGRGR